MNRTLFLLPALIVALCSIVTVRSSFAQDLATSSVTAVSESPTANAAMQEYMRLIAPGKGHKIFSSMTGKWNCKMKIWNSAAPSAPPMESSEKSESKLVLGGRFLLEESNGSMMGMPMQRMSLLGYDNYKKIYTLIFYSNLDTATNAASGTLDADGKVLTLRGEFDEPQGKEPFKNVIRIESDDVRVFESYRILTGGKELKVIEETYTRAK